uniref:NADH-ubiquinone oxidoreductase chain 6 n=1 Tax=Microcaecilia dermatophaga TaxID=1415579 RepID=W5RHF7_9AMPH|nr:NADH dehydrogenase subunit 6 [Microcaecilia dermatophaga]AGZ19057.1 NADH dehydrogenase subunit 6 [Microcaecilia dermatophaga]
MAYIIFLGLLGFMFSMVGVASNPSPYYAAFGLVLGTASGCLVLAGFGVTFLSLILFLIYLGGMMVVFAYSAAMAAEPYPEAWGSVSVVFYVLFYCGVLGVGFGFIDSIDVLFNVSEFSAVRCDWGGVSMLYLFGGLLLLILGWVLLITLFVVLEITRAVKFGSVCA